MNHQVKIHTRDGRRTVNGHVVRFATPKVEFRLQRITSYNGSTILPSGYTCSIEKAVGGEVAVVREI